MTSKNPPMDGYTPTQRDQAEYLAVIFLTALGYPGPSIDRPRAADTLTFVDQSGVVMIRDQFLFEEGLIEVADVYESISFARYRPHPSDLPRIPGQSVIERAADAAARTPINSLNFTADIPTNDLPGLLAEAREFERELNRAGAIHRAEKEGAYSAGANWGARASAYAQELTKRGIPTDYKNGTF